MNYYNQIESFIKKNEVNKKVRVLEENYDTLNNYWNIGRLLVDAQGGSTHAKYGNALIKEWSIKYTEKYGSGYDASNLRRFRQFYIVFPNCGPLGHNLKWTHIRYILPIKEENERNFYINLCVEKSLSKRELISVIKSNTYERLVNKSEKIEIKSNIKTFPLDNMQNPIILKLTENETISSEHDLEVKLLSELNIFFSQLGTGFALIGNQYKITVDDKNYYIDILPFNVKMNCYFVVELKLRKLQKKDKAQIEFYMDAIDNNVKEVFHNKTSGIITKEQDKFIANFVRSESIINLQT